MNDKLLCQLYETGLQLIKVIIDSATESKVIDTQEYLNFLDALNELSVSH